MAKKTSKASSSRNQDTSAEIVTPTAWVDVGIMDAPDRHHSTMSTEKITEVQMLFKSDVVVAVPEAPIEADWLKEGWVCFYYYPFDIGMAFPFSNLVREVLIAMNVSPVQLMSSAWRTLACLDAVESKHNLGIDVAVVKHSFSLKKFNNCRFGFVNKKKDEPLILNNDMVNDRGWKNEFFFAEIASLGKDVDYALDRWTLDGTSYLLSCNLYSIFALVVCLENFALCFSF